MAASNTNVARATQRSTRQSPYKMRLVIDEIRGKSVNDALAYLAFSKKHAAKQIEKTLRSAVANAEHASRGLEQAWIISLLAARARPEQPPLERPPPSCLRPSDPCVRGTVASARTRRACVPPCSRSRRPE